MYIHINGNLKRPLYAAISKAGPDDSEAMEIIDMLLHHPKINVNIGSYNDEKDLGERSVSPLIKAFKMKNMNVVAKLLDFPELEMDFGENPLYYACELGDYKLVERILSLPTITYKNANKRVSLPLPLSLSSYLSAALPLPCYYSYIINSELCEIVLDLSKKNKTKF